jgi:hypothetical protein
MFELEKPNMTLNPGNPDSVSCIHSTNSVVFADICDEANSVGLFNELVKCGSESCDCVKSVSC